MQRLLLPFVATTTATLIIRSTTGDKTRLNMVLARIRDMVGRRNRTRVAFQSKIHQIIRLVARVESDSPVAQTQTPSLLHLNKTNGREKIYCSTRHTGDSPKIAIQQILQVTHPTPWTPLSKTHGREKTCLSTRHTSDSLRIKVAPQRTHLSHLTPRILEVASGGEMSWPR